MDTLADLASMQYQQQQQQTPRKNSNPMRNEGQIVNQNVRPSLQQISRTHSGSRSSLDINMADTPAQTPPPRNFTSNSLSDSDIQLLNQLAGYLSENPHAYESHVQLVKLLHKGFVAHVNAPSSPTVDSHPLQYSLLQDLLQAREAMVSRFAIGEELWVERIQDQQILASNLEDCVSVIELFEKAVLEEPSSVRLWALYGNWMLSLYSAGNPDDEAILQLSRPLPSHMRWAEEDRLAASQAFGRDQLFELWKRAAEETIFQIGDSNIIWDTYADLLLQDLNATRSQDTFKVVKDLFIERLQIPHATWNDTFQKFGNIISTNQSTEYEAIMVDMTRVGSDAKKKSEMRESLEMRLQKAATEGDKATEWSVMTEYLDFEMSQSRKRKAFDFNLTNALFQRATLRFPTDTNIWEDYLMFLGEEADKSQTGKLVLSLLGRACEHCPWSGSLWAQYIQGAEREMIPFPDVGQIKHKATSTGLLDAGNMEELLKIHTTWCGFLRRQAFLPDSLDEDLDVAEVGIRSAIEDMENLGIQKYGKEYKGDPQYRLERNYIKFLCQRLNYRGARDTWKDLVKRHGDSYEFWLAYYNWEMIIWAHLSDENKPSQPPREATEVLRQATKRPHLDWPEKIIDTYLHHAEDHEDPVELQATISQCRKATKAVARRREREAKQAAELAQQQLQAAAMELDSIKDSQQTASKRKRDDIEESATATPAKKSKSDHEPTELQSQAPDSSLTTQSSLKRDRENSTLVVKNLPKGATEKKVRHFFRDCGTINTINLTSEDNGTMTATVEFESKEDLLAGQTKDMKMFDGHSIEIKIGTGTTIYVTNFPPTADEAYIRELFGKYGDIVDIRFPSLKFNTHRRFCYVQFKTSGQAKAATELDGTVLDGNFSLVAKISDPGKKQRRHGALEEGREVYVCNVDWKASEAEIKELFSKHGKVEQARIPRNVAGKSKGVAFVVFSTKEEANAALELNLTKFKTRVIEVEMSSHNPSKRQATTIVSRASGSPQPDQNGASRHDTPDSALSPGNTGAHHPSREEIAARTIALLNVPDTVNDARIRALVEPHGALTKIVLRPDHQGAIIEFQDASSAGKATLAVDGYKIAEGRKLGVGTVKEMLAQKAEYKITDTERDSQKAGSGPAFQGAGHIKRPTQPGAGRGRRGGLGFKRGGVTAHVGGDHDSVANGNGTHDTANAEIKASKSNADFKAMFLKK